MANPYKHSSGAIQHRTSSGRFARTSIDCAVCTSCGQLLMSEVDYATGSPVKRYPKECHRCGGTEIREQA